VADLAGGGGKTGQLGGRATPCHPLATGLPIRPESSLSRENFILRVDRIVSSKLQRKLAKHPHLQLAS
jgi:hypothetical protein